MDFKTFYNTARELHRVMEMKVARREIESFVMRLNGDDREIVFEIIDNHGKAYDYTITHDISHGKEKKNAAKIVY